MKHLLLPLLAAMALPGAVNAITTSLAFLQVGVMDRENKKKMEQLFKSIEELEGNPWGIVDI